MDYNGRQNTRRRKPKRRLKKNVKLCLYTFLVLVLVVTIRPWRWISPKACSDSKASSLIVTDTLIPLNQRLSNADSDTPEAERFDRLVNQFINRWHIKGASLAVMKHGNLIYSKGYGYADTEDSVLTEVKHIFRIASVSKLITAVGVMKLYEQGRLRMDSKVFGPKGILSEFKGYTDRRVENITVEHLLRHRAGFTIRSGDPMFSPVSMEVARRMDHKKVLDMNTMIRYAMKTGLGYTPGGRTKYSNLGYVILSAVIEKVSKMGYEKYIQDSILHPIGCHDMHLAQNTHDKKYTNEVRYYESEDAEPVEACDGSGHMVSKCDGGNDIHGLMGAGGWVASPVELLIFASAIDENNSKPNILRPSTIRLMTSCTKQELPIGWMKVKGNGDWLRTGSMAGTSAMLRRQSNGYTWVFVTNTSSWKGARFPNLINAMINSALGRVEDWPEKDMFDSLSYE